MKYVFPAILLLIFLYDHKDMWHPRLWTSTPRILAGAVGFILFLVFGFYDLFTNDPAQKEDIEKVGKKVDEMKNQPNSGSRVELSNREWECNIEKTNDTAAPYRLHYKFRIINRGPQVAENVSQIFAVVLRVALPNDIAVVRADTVLWFNAQHIPTDVTNFGVEGELHMTEDALPQTEVHFVYRITWKNPSKDVAKPDLTWFLSWKKGFEVYEQTDPKIVDQLKGATLNASPSFWKSL